MKKLALVVVVAAVVGGSGWLVWNRWLRPLGPTLEQVPIITRHHFVGQYYYDEEKPVVFTFIEQDEGLLLLGQAQFPNEKFWKRDYHWGDGWFTYLGSMEIADDGTVKGQVQENRHRFEGRLEGSLESGVLTADFTGGRPDYDDRRDVELRSDAPLLAAQWSGRIVAFEPAFARVLVEREPADTTRPPPRRPMPCVLDRESKLVAAGRVISHKALAEGMQVSVSGHRTGEGIAVAELSLPAARQLAGRIEQSTPEGFELSFDDGSDLWVVPHAGLPDVTGWSGKPVQCAVVPYTRGEQVVWLAADE